VVILCFSTTHKILFFRTLYNRDIGAGSNIPSCGGTLFQVPPLLGEAAETTEQENFDMFQLPLYESKRAQTQLSAITCTNKCTHLQMASQTRRRVYIITRLFFTAIFLPSLYGGQLFLQG
jgi:hypothetical protein